MKTFCFINESYRTTKNFIEQRLCDKKLGFNLDTIQHISKKYISETFVNKETGEKGIKT